MGPVGSSGVQILEIGSYDRPKLFRRQSPQQIQMSSRSQYLGKASYQTIILSIGIGNIDQTPSRVVDDKSADALDTSAERSVTLVASSCFVLRHIIKDR